MECACSSADMDGRRFERLMHQLLGFIYSVNIRELESTGPCSISSGVF